MYQVADFTGNEGNLQLLFKWFNLDKLAQTRLYPTCLRQKLTQLPAGIGQMIHYSDDENSIPSE